MDLKLGFSSKGTSIDGTENIWKKEKVKGWRDVHNYKFHNLRSSLITLE
jgi:hypothetical protein